MYEENDANGRHTTLAVMEGELTAITVKNSGDELLVFAPTGPMTAIVVAALRRAYPTNQIVEKSSRPGVVIHGVQTMQGFAE